MTVGAPIRHPEWQERTAGAIAYTRDVAAAGALTGHILRCPHPHARISWIDTAAASRAPGVVAVLTGADFPGRNYKDYGQADRPPMARDMAVHFGQEVAVIAAETAIQAKHAAGLIRVGYRPAPAVTSLDAALARRAPRVHPELGPDNVATSARRVFGDFAAAWDHTSHRVRARYDCGIQVHACMEPHAVLAVADAKTGMLDIWTPTQSARNVRAEIAWMLDLDVENVRLHRVAIGGDFGSRVKISDIEVLAATLSMRTGRPVRIDLSRGDEFAFTKRQHECRIDLETGADRDGLVTGRRAEVTVENGAFIHGGSNMMNYCSILLGSQYRLQGAEIHGRSVYTNRRPGGAFRGAGGPQATFAIESQMDELADELGIDPIELRLRNLNTASQTTITGWEMGSVHAADCLRAVRERLGWDEARKNGGKGRGVGVALALHVSGAIVSPATAKASVAIEIGHNGGVVLSSGCSDPGTGETALIAQICASELGIEAHGIQLNVMDTATTPFDPGAGSSRATTITGGAVLAASRRAAETLRGLAAAHFGVDAGSIVLEAGQALCGDRRISIGELAASHSGYPDGVLKIDHEEIVDNPVVGMTAADSGIGNLSPSYSFAAHGVEVEVDLETGAVSVLRVVAAHDAGTVINPVGARGQVVGGVVMGIGAALGEELIYEQGRPVTTSYLDYAMPRASGAPPVEVIFTEGSSPKGPYGAKSIAEIALMPTAAAIANAVAHATGVRIRSLPISPDKIVDALAGRSHGHPASLWARPGRWWSEAVRRAYPLGLHDALHRSASPIPTGSLPESGIEEIVTPGHSDRAIGILAENADSARPAGAATDILALRDQGFAAPATLVRLSRCADMNAVDEDAAGNLVIGAATTLADLAKALDGSTMPADRALAATVASIATPQIRAVATVAGNLCQAKRCWFYRGGFNCYKRGGFTRPCYAVLGDHRFYHAVLGAGRCQAVTPSDLATTLTALDAQVDVRRSGAAPRRLAIAAFYRGPGETVLARDEIVHSLVVSAAARRRATHFEKFSLTSDGFAVVSACASIGNGPDMRLADCRAVLGGVAARPHRALETERYLVAHGSGKASQIEAAAALWSRQAHPLANNKWKITAATAVLRRALESAIAGASPAVAMPFEPMEGVVS